ncbi:MAG: hypothetical protein LBV70_04210 [Candidatus Adiutrix sp.]|jgi:hypothetical protein|nr:hypothetical protein [Candidatus Adiutrix sp.]
MEQAQYKAKVPCRIGGAYRRAGEVFTMPKFETVPYYLEEVPGADGPRPHDSSDHPAPAASGSAGKKRAGPGAGLSPAPGPMPGDLPGVVRD